jgi:hypothetical protein
MECSSDMLKGKINYCYGNMISLLDITAGTPQCSATARLTRLQVGQLENQGSMPG